MYTIIEDRGKQYKVSTGDRLLIDMKEGIKCGDILEFHDVLVCSDGEGNASFGAENNKNLKVTAEVERIMKGTKCMTIKFRRRKESMTRRGHRQKYVQVRIKDIQGI